MVNEQSYLNWQQKLADKKLFRRFWFFWAIYSVVFVFAAGLYLLVIGQLKVVVLALLSFVFARLIISPLIYFFYKKQRPYQVGNFQTLYSRLLSAATKKANSFPSDHAISFAALATVMGYFYPWIGLGLVICAALNGFGRVILGYHYLLDIFGGWLLGILSGLIIIFWLGPIIFR